MHTLASLFNLAGPDLIVIFFVAMLLFGAKKLPELAKGLGQAVREFTKAKNDFANEISNPSLPDKP
jgi:sec-independent protein translocase protein TatA